MSLPLTRRIAKAALLTAAGAATVVGAAGAASADTQPKASDLGGLSNLDTEGVTNVVGDAAHTGTKLAGEAGDSAVRESLPSAGGVTGEVGEAAAPTVEKVAGNGTTTATGLLHDTGNAAAGKLPADRLPTEDLTLDQVGNGLTPGSMLG